MRAQTRSKPEIERAAPPLDPPPVQSTHMRRMLLCATLLLASPGSVDCLRTPLPAVRRRVGSVQMMATVVLDDSDCAVLEQRSCDYVRMGTTRLPVALEQRARLAVVQSLGTRASDLDGLLVAASQLLQFGGGSADECGGGGRRCG